MSSSRRDFLKGVLALPVAAAAVALVPKEKPVPRLQMGFDQGQQSYTQIRWVTQMDDRVQHAVMRWNDPSVDVLKDIQAAVREVRRAPTLRPIRIVRS